MSTIEEHRAAPHISIDQHVQHRVVELGRSLDSRAAVYLDMRFWIMLRQSALGDDPDPSVAELLQLLRSRVAQGAIFCPVSDGVFLELLKQTDLKSRLATARLVDELSLGVTLLTNQARVATELARFFQGCTPSISAEDALHPLRHLVWSKLPYVLGFVHPYETAFDAATERAIQKAFFDRLWTVPLSQMIEMIGAEGSENLSFSILADKLTRGAAEHAASLRSFKHTLEEEMRGAADLCADMGAEIMAAIIQKQSGMETLEGSAEWGTLRNFCANVIFHVLKNTERARKEIPTIHIEACLHAAIRWDKQRPFRANDIYDFEHAASALAHCQAFFTEYPLRMLLESKHMKLREHYGCFVTSVVSDAIDYLNTLDRGGSAYSPKPAQGST